MEDNPIIMVSADYLLNSKWSCAVPPIVYECGIADGTKGLLTSNLMNETGPLTDIRNRCGGTTCRVKVTALFFNDGSDLALTFPRQMETRSRWRSGFRRHRIRSNWREIDNELLVVPTHNIKYLRLSPCPEMLPETVIVDGAIKTYG